MKNFKAITFIFATIVFCFLTSITFIAAMAGEEGTLGTNVFAMTLEKLYFIFRFPTHSLFSFFYSNGWSWFVIGLIFNCLLYGILTERFICFYKNIAGKNGK